MSKKRTTLPKRKKDAFSTQDEEKERSLPKTISTPQVNSTQKVELAPSVFQPPYPYPYMGGNYPGHGGSIFHSMIRNSPMYRLGPGTGLPGVGYNYWGFNGEVMPSTSRVQDPPGVSSVPTFHTASAPSSYDGLTPIRPSTTYKEGGASVKFDTYDGESDKMTALTFI